MDFKAILDRAALCFDRVLNEREPVTELRKKRENLGLKMGELRGPLREAVILSCLLNLMLEYWPLISCFLLSFRLPPFQTKSTRNPIHNRQHFSIRGLLRRLNSWAAWGNRTRTWGGQGKVWAQLTWLLENTDQYLKMGEGLKRKQNKEQHARVKAT